MHAPTATLIFNPNSGKGKATTLAHDFAQHWQQKMGSSLPLRPTRSHQDIRVAAKECEPGRTPIFMGGDGTFSESLQGLAENNNFMPLQQPVGLLPGGTGNSLLRDFGLLDYPSARDALLQAIATQQSQTLDAALLRYQTTTGQKIRRMIFNIWGIDLLAEITVLAVRLRRLGSINYSLASLVTMLTHQPKQRQLILDGKRQSLRCNTVALCNSRFTGGNMEIAPAIRLNDGKLFAVIPQFTNKRGLFGLFPQIFKGTHIHHPAVRSQFLRSFQVEDPEPLLMNIDGEIEQGCLPKIEIVPGFWRLWSSKVIM